MEVGTWQMFFMVNTSTSMSSHLILSKEYDSSVFGLSFAALKHAWLPLGKWIELEKGKCSMLMVARCRVVKGGPTALSN